MKLSISKRVLMFICILFISSYCYSGNRNSWESKPTYDAVPDSLKKYDIINIFFKNKIKIRNNSPFEINYTIHQKTKIFSQKGLEVYSQFFLPDAKLLETVKARTIKPDGSAINLKQDDIKITVTESGAGFCKFIVPGTNIGDEVEFMISYTVKNSVLIDDIFFHKEFFTLQSELLIVPSEFINIETKGYNKLPPPKLELLKNKKTYSWSLNGLEQIGKKNKIIIHNDLPFLRVVVRSLSNEYGSKLPIEFANWKDYQNVIQFDEYVGHRLSNDANLGSFINEHFGAEATNLSKEDRFGKLIKTISFINDSINLFYARDTIELNKPLGDHLKDNKLPIGLVNDLYSILLERTYFDYYLCLGRNRYLGDIDIQFVSRNQITDVFFAFEFDTRFYFVFPKTNFSSYDFGEIPDELEGSRAIIFPRKGNSLTATVVTLPNSIKANNTKTVNTFAYVNINENLINEHSKLITTGALTSIYRNGYKNLRKDSIDSADIYKFIFNTSEELIDSLIVEKNEHFTPFVFSLKFNKIEKNYLTYLSDSLKMIPLNKIISHFLPESNEDENQDSHSRISFLFSDNIKYYLIFDKEVKIIDQGNGDVNFENEFGTFDLQIKQLNPKTVFIFSRLNFNKSNLDTIDSSPLSELGNKIRDARNINLSFKIME